MDAIVEQLREIPYVYPCQVNSPIRAKLSAFLGIHAGDGGVWLLSLRFFFRF